MFITRIIPEFAVAVAALSAPTVAHAQQATVRIHSSELSTPVGRQAVIKRIHRAAARACYNGGTLYDVMRTKKCAGDLSDQMVAQLPRTEAGAQLASRGRPE